MHKWKSLDSGVDKNYALDHDVHNTACILNLLSDRRTKEWWISGSHQKIKSFGPYPTADEAKRAAEMLQAQGLLD